MSKRDRQAEEDDRPPKRMRPDYQPPLVEEIHYARQIQQFLTFRQDGIQQLRNGIASFKYFLESILYHREEDNRARQISILREYFETQKPADPRSTEQPFLSQLWQAWSFANQNNNDHLASSVSAIIALLVKTVSGILDLRDYGALLCRTVLQHQHLRLVKRCVDAPKHKDFIISPSLRLLTEVATFDGGLVANELYKRREQTFDINNIRRNLALIKPDLSEEEARRKPSIRTLALRYVLALLKHLQPGAKADILKSRPICTVIFQFLRDDPADLVTELLVTVEQSILKDPEVLRSSKAAILTPQNLERVTEIATRSGDEHAASDRAIAWLKAVSTSTSYGVLRPCGWYPPGTTKLDSWHKDSAIDLGLDSVDFYDTMEAPSVRNPALFAWILQLKPHSNERERDLVLTCFRSSPELVAAYFSEKPLQLEPKLSNTWIGYASFLFEVIRLHLPDEFDFDGESPLPPQTTIAMENILPRPLTQQVLSRCLNQSNELVTFFTIRLLVLACEKLASVMKRMQLKTEVGTRTLWEQAQARLAERFSERCPPMKDVIAIFRKMAADDDHVLQRESITRLLRLYYDFLPLQALEEQFDISGPLTAALTRNEQSPSAVNGELRCLRQLELEHLLAVAKRSPGIKWFTKQGGLSYSPIVSLLRIHRYDLSNTQMRKLLNHVLSEHGILTNRGNLSSHKESAQALASDALVASLHQLTDESPVWVFLDDCLGRATRKPVKYVDDLSSLDPSQGTSKLPSVLSAVLLEQAPFAVAKREADGTAKFAWIASFVHLLRLTSDAGPILDKIAHCLVDLDKHLTRDGGEGLPQLLQKVRQHKHDEHAVHVHHSHSARNQPEYSFPSPPVESDSHPELTCWSQKDIELAIDDGDLEALIFCLSSSHNDIRRQGLTQLNKLKLQLTAASSAENHAQISLLIGELTETFELNYLTLDAPLPYIASCFAARALRVQTQPSHYIYPKLNKYLIRGPEWRVGKMPSYWLSTTILSMPDEDDSFWKEVQWVLDWLVDGLRTPADLDIFRRGCIFERTLALWMSPGTSSHKLVRQSVSELLYRATCIEGGSNTLVTRAGVLDWLDMVRDEKDNRSAFLKERVLDTVNMEKFKSWTGVRKEVAIA